LLRYARRTAASDCDDSSAHRRPCWFRAPSTPESRGCSRQRWACYTHAPLAGGPPGPLQAAPRPGSRPGCRPPPAAAAAQTHPLAACWRGPAVRQPVCARACVCVWRFCDVMTATWQRQTQPTGAQVSMLLARDRGGGDAPARRAPRPATSSLV
jgi:hypothetical protein